MMIVNVDNNKLMKGKAKVTIQNVNILYTNQNVHVVDV